MDSAFSQLVNPRQSEFGALPSAQRALSPNRISARFALPDPEQVFMRTLTSLVTALGLLLSVNASFSREAQNASKCVGVGPLTTTLFRQSGCSERVRAKANGAQWADVSCTSEDGKKSCSCKTECERSESDCHCSD